MTIPRLYVADELAQGAPLVLTDKAAHYLGNVLRKKGGDSVLLFNGTHGEWRAEITECRKKALELVVHTQTREQYNVPDIGLVFAPIKSGRIDFLVEKATELGVSALYPVKTERTIVSRVNEEKLRLNAIEAAEQTERLDIPQVHPYQPLTHLLNKWDASCPLFYGDESGGGAPADVLLEGKAPPLAVLIGPEGGFTDAEFRHLRSHQFTHPLSLGSRILRADTAALASLTLLQLYCGDWKDNG